MTEENKPKVAYVCQQCWSTELTFEAACYWDVDKQEFAVSDMRDSECSGCDSGYCRTDTFDMTEEGNIMYPTVDAVIESGDAEHIVSRARIAAEEENATMNRDIEMLYDAVIKTESLHEMLLFVRQHRCVNQTRVEDEIVLYGNAVQMKDYIEYVKWGDTQRMLQKLLERASGDVSVLQELVITENKTSPPYLRPRDLGLSPDDLFKVRAVYKLLGGKV